jgi:hypothetical protein
VPSRPWFRSRPISAMEAAFSFSSPSPSLPPPFSPRHAAERARFTLCEMKRTLIRESVLAIPILERFPIEPGGLRLISSWLAVLVLVLDSWCLDGLALLEPRPGPHDRCRRGPIHLCHSWVLPGGA